MKGLGQYILDEQGEPKLCEDLLTWGRWMENGNRIVWQDDVGPYFVSTVFLGLDHSFREAVPPVLWETMVFRSKDGKRDWGDLYCRRYTSREDAIKGHEEAVGLAVDGGPWER